MKTKIIVILIIFAVILLPPILLRKKDAAPVIPPAGTERLVIITPHPDTIKTETGNAFREYYKKKYGKDIILDFRAPGGTSDITRFIADRYKIEFREVCEKNGIRSEYTLFVPAVGDCEVWIVKLTLVNRPAYTKYDPYVGNLTRQPAGTLINEAVYLHPMAWKLAAECILKRYERLQLTLEKILPWDNSYAPTCGEPYILYNFYLNFKYYFLSVAPIDSSLAIILALTSSISLSVRVFS
jgi:hypothetical protein